MQSQKFPLYKSALYKLANSKVEWFHSKSERLAYGISQRLKFILLNEILLAAFKIVRLLFAIAFSCVNSLSLSIENPFLSLLSFLSMFLSFISFLSSYCVYYGLFGIFFLSNLMLGFLHLINQIIDLTFLYHTHLL